jgi:hypothetical protein
VKKSRWSKRLRLLGRFSLASVGLYGMSVVGLAAWERFAPVDLPTYQRPQPEELSFLQPEPWVVVPDRVRRGDTLASLLQRNGFTPLEVHQMAEALTPHFNLRRRRCGSDLDPSRSTPDL